MLERLVPELKNKIKQGRNEPREFRSRLHCLSSLWILYKETWVWAAKYFGYFIVLKVSLHSFRRLYAFALLLRLNLPAFPIVHLWAGTKHTARFALFQNFWGLVWSSFFGLFIFLCFLTAVYKLHISEFVSSDYNSFSFLSSLCSCFLITAINY